MVQPEMAFAVVFVQACDTVSDFRIFSSFASISHLKYSIPPEPTLLTVKLLPSLELGGGSLLGSLDAFCDRCRRISVLFLTRLSEVLLLLLPSLRDEESFRVGFVFASRMSGATNAEGGFLAEVLVLEVFCDVLLREEPVTCLATAGSTDMKDSSLPCDEVWRIVNASYDRVERFCLPISAMVCCPC